MSVLVPSSALRENDDLACTRRGPRRPHGRAKVRNIYRPVSGGELLARRHRLIRTSTAGVRAAGAPCHNLGVAATALHAEPVRVVLDRMALQDLSRRLRATRLVRDGGGTWARGTPGDWLTELVADGQPAFDRDHLLSTLTLYWTTRTAASSLVP
jgi:hypothetical protein